MGHAVLPRMLFREVLLGLEDRVREHLPQVYSCLLCRMCEDNCPAKVRIAENVRRLRTILNRREYKLD
jgi:heterodisulfide reductase subunit C2